MPKRPRKQNEFQRAHRRCRKTARDLVQGEAQYLSVVSIVALERDLRRSCRNECAYSMYEVLTNQRLRLADAAPVTALAPPVKSGDIFRLPGVEWSAPRTVVLVVSSTCPACNANLPFYRQLAASKIPQVEIVALSQESPAAMGAWLSQNQVNVTTIHTVANASSLGLSLTPTILILDAGGRVTDLMIRKLDESDQTRVLERIRNRELVALDTSYRVREISVNDLEAMRSHRSIHILDVRPREQFANGHRGEAKNIPYPELSARAPVELELHVPVVVDCVKPSERLATMCRGAAWTLIDLHFDDVSIVTR
jgi:rhodanese-related sulfurtransferase